MRLHVKFGNFVNEGRYTSCDEKDLYDVDKQLRAWDLPEWFVPTAMSIIAFNDDAATFFDLYERFKTFDLQDYVRPFDSVIEDISKDVFDGEVFGISHSVASWSLDVSHRVLSLSVTDLDGVEIQPEGGVYTESDFEYEIREMVDDLDYVRIANKIRWTASEEYKEVTDGEQWYEDTYTEDNKTDTVISIDYDDLDAVLEVQLQIIWKLVLEIPVDGFFWSDETCGILKDYEAMMYSYEQIKDIVEALHAEGGKDAMDVLSSF